MAEKTAKPKKKSEFSKNTTGDKIILITGFVILGLFVLAIILPVIYIILASFISDYPTEHRFDI